MKADWIPTFMIVIVSCSMASAGWGAAPAADDSVVDGKPLEQWIDQLAPGTAESQRREAIEALRRALLRDDPEMKVAAADALATLGPEARDAIPELIGQLGHIQPWVRVAVMAALAAIGPDAVPALIDTFKNETGGPHYRAAFVLANIGPDAAAAVPVIEAALPDEPPVAQVRLRGILSQIVPDRYPPSSVTRRAEQAKVDFKDVVDATFAQRTADWPGFHGPYRDSVCRETGLLDRWPDEGPRLLWEVRGLGKGYSSVSIANGVLLTMGDWEDQTGETRQYVIAVDLATRTRRWSVPIGPPHEDGPRSTPTIDLDSVYALGTDGDLVCLDLETGSVRWRRHLVNDFGGQMMSGWKYSESPLIDGDRLICTPGGSEAAMVALNKKTGQLIWKTAVPDLGPEGVDGAGYSSPVAGVIAGTRQYVQLMGRGVVGVDAVTGRFLWGYNRIANTIANIPTPVVKGDYVFVTTAYNTGAALLKIERSGDDYSANEVYFIGPRDFQNHHGGVVLVDRHLYGGHGVNRGDPTCIDLTTGEVVWKERAPARGSASVLYADGRLIFRYDRGDVVLVDATPEGFRMRGRFVPPQGDGPAWSHPVVHGGKLYLRHSDLLLCYDLRAYQ